MNSYLSVISRKCLLINQNVRYLQIAVDNDEVGILLSPATCTLQKINLWSAENKFVKHVLMRCNQEKNVDLDIIERRQACYISCA